MYEKITQALQFGAFCVNAYIYKCDIECDKTILDTRKG